MTMTDIQSQHAPVTWTLVADSARARLFESRGKDALDEIEIQTNPAARANEAELVTDGAGRFAGGRTVGHGATSAARDDASGHETEKFAKHLADMLRVAHANNRFAKLRLFAGPEFLGRLRRSLDAHVAALVVEEVAHDYTRLSGDALTAKLAPAIPPA